VDFFFRKSGDPRLLGMPPSEARAALESRHSQGRERNARDWLHDLQNKQQMLLSERGLDHPAIASNVAILNDQGQATLDVCRSYLEAWLRPLIVKGGEVRIRAERQMTETFRVAKIKKAWPVVSVLDDKVWGKLFDYGNEYQAVVIEFVQAGAEFPVVGMGLNYSLRQRKTTSPDLEWNEYNEGVIALTLGKMRGRRFDGVTQGHTLHVYNWIINHNACYQYLETSINDIKGKIDAVAAECSPLQAWHGQSTWIPVFDQADGVMRPQFMKI
jgi:hypothetical protein